MVAARALLTHKGRTAQAAFLVEGPHAVGAGLASRRHPFRELFVTAEAAGRDPAILAAAREQGAAVRLVSERVIGVLSDAVSPQGLVAVAAAAPSGLARLAAAGPELVAILDRVGDPGNAGTVIRTADAAGASGVVTTAGSVDVWSPKCVRATAGSIFHLDLVVDADPVAAVTQLRAAGCQVLATAADADDDLDALVDAGALSVPTAWIFGNEAHGVGPELRAAAGRVVRLPIYGFAESLNLAATAAICLYASARARRGSRCESRSLGSHRTPEEG